MGGTCLLRACVPVPCVHPWMTASCVFRILGMICVHVLVRDFSMSRMWGILFFPLQDFVYAS
eukprot:m.510190 g.510190  ORF g.510190 m.510190 type:complete len:62 (-) comp96180_c0_seq1:2-187(-)